MKKNNENSNKNVPTIIGSDLIDDGISFDDYGESKNNLN